MCCLRSLCLDVLSGRCRSMYEEWILCVLSSLASLAHAPVGNECNDCCNISHGGNVLAARMCMSFWNPTGYFSADGPLHKYDRANRNVGSFIAYRSLSTLRSSA